MDINRKTAILFALRTITLVSILFLFTDMIGTLFVGDDYMVRAWFRCKVIAFLTLICTAYLFGSNVLRWPTHQLAYIGYPLYLVLMALCGIFTAPHDLLGYKIALALAPFVAHKVNQHGKGWLRRYLRIVQKLAGGRIVNKKGMALFAGTLAIAILFITGIYDMRGICHFHLRKYIIENIPIVTQKKEKPNHNPDLKDRRDPYRNYPKIFNDLNDTQLVAARANGTPRALTIEEIEVGMYGLKRIETNKLYKVDPLTHSAPYLVPKAKDFLDELGEAFQDSLYNRGYDRRHRFIVTSVYRTENHIKRLRRSGNVNASTNSCHQYGTTIDITYVRFDKPEENRANDPKLLQLLMQTVYDMHKSERCYVKYERRQSCLHITVR